MPGEPGTHCTHWFAPLQTLPMQPWVESHSPHWPIWLLLSAIQTVPEAFIAHCASAAAPSMLHGTHVFVVPEQSGAPAFVHWLFWVQATHTPCVRSQWGVPVLSAH